MAQGEQEGQPRSLYVARDSEREHACHRCHDEDSRHGVRPEVIDGPQPGDDQQRLDDIRTEGRRQIEPEGHLGSVSKPLISEDGIAESTVSVVVPLDVHPDHVIMHVFAL